MNNLNGESGGIRTHPAHAFSVTYLFSMTTEAEKAANKGDFATSALHGTHRTTIAAAVPPPSEVNRLLLKALEAAQAAIRAAEQEG